MTADDARRLLLARHLLGQRPAPLAPEVVARANADALRAEGESAQPERLAVRRATLLLDEAQRTDPGLRHALRATREPRGWVAILLVVAALAGFGLDLVGPSGRINILAPPVLGLIVWNLLVYAALALRRMRALPAFRFGAAARASLLRRLASDTTSPAVAAFGAAWADAAVPLMAARIAQAFHLAAALLAAAMLASMYARGLAFEFRAGWDSTFLDATAVHRILATVLGPASALSGISLPDAAQLDALRFSRGGMENAARWIHLHALTVLAIVVLPRVLLAALAAIAARRLDRDFPLTLDPADLAGLPVEGGRRVPVIAYGYEGATRRRGALGRELMRSLGQPVEPVLAPGVPLGGEDELARTHGALPPGTADDAPLVLLFPMTATPEREHHGAFVRAVRSRWPGRRLLTVVDESGFRARLDGPAAATRIEPRRAAWRAAFGAAPLFVDLEPDDADG